MKRKGKRISNGSLVRLIDVVLILLFGFIAVSEVEQKSFIRMAKSVAVPPTQPDRETVVYVGVTANGTYLVEGETATVGTVDQLTKYLAAKNLELDQYDASIRVRVRANFDSPVKFSFRVVDICQNLNIPVGLDVIRVGGGR